MDIEGKDNEYKEVVESKNLIRIPINYDEERYLLKIFPSKDNVSIIFKLEKEKIQTYYYYAKLIYRDFEKINKKFISDKNIYNVFIRLKEITQNSMCNLEKDSMKINILFTKHNTGFSANFTVRKKIVAQNRLNANLIEQIQENKNKIKMLKKQIAKLDKIIRNKNDLIDNINSTIDNITNSVNNININLNNTDNIDSDNSKTTIKSISHTSTKSSDESPRSQEKENNSETKNEFKNSEKENLLLKTNLSMIKEYEIEQEQEGKRFISNNKKRKNKNNYKQIKNIFKKEEEKPKIPYQKEDTLFCFENSDVYKNKKIYETLIIFNAITVLIIIYLLCSIYTLKSNLILDKIKDHDLLKKIAFLSLIDDSTEDDLEGMRENIVDFQLKSNNLVENTTPQNTPPQKKKVRYAIIRKKQKEEPKELTFLNDEKDKKYFKKHIRKRLKYRVRDVNFNLRYNSNESEKYTDFYENVKEISDVLLLLRTIHGVKLGVFCNNKILYEQNLRNSETNYAGYIFGIENIYDIEINEFFNHYGKYIQNIYDFIDREIYSNKNRYNNTNKQLLGDVDLFEIYQLEY